MNILLPYRDLRKAANTLTTLHRNKQAIECLQLIACACAERDWPMPIAQSGRAYVAAASRANHPVGKWARQSRANILFTLRYAIHCADRKCLNGDKPATYYTAINLREALRYYIGRPYAPSSFIFCAINRPRWEGDIDKVCAAYRNYLNAAKGYSIKE